MNETAAESLAYEPIHPGAGRPGGPGLRKRIGAALAAVVAFAAKAKSLLILIPKLKLLTTFGSAVVSIGRAAMMAGRPDEAEIAFAQAAEMQESNDFSSVSDPPAWHYPVRRDLALALLQQNDVAGARREAHAALKYRPKDPGTLTLLSKLEARSAAR